MEKTKFRIDKSSDHKYIDFLELETIAELLDWIKKTGNDVIVSFDRDGNPTLEIYDYWRE